MQGDAASDIMRIDRAGAVLSHGRATAGDPGFASDTDFDTGSGGVQTVNASTPFIVSINAGPGSDVVALGGVGQSASTLQSDFNIDGGGDFDAVLIDSSEDIVARTATFASSIGTGSVAITGNGGIGDFSHTDVETVALRVGSASDSAVVNSTESGVSVEGGGGNDTVTVGAAAGLPSIVGRVDFDGDAGTLNAGGGNDLISSRDAIGDTTNCGAGDDFVLSDSLDTLNECESSDRTLAQPPSGGGGDGSTDTSMTTMMTSMMTMPADMADKTAPTAALSGLKSSVRLKTLLKGLKAKVLSNEPASYEVQLLASTSSARLARTYNLVLAKQNLTLDNAIRDIKLKPSKRLIGRARKFSVRIVVTPTDAAGNRGKAVTKTVKVKR